MMIADDGAWCWFGDPRALHYEGEFRRTYIGYLTSAGEIVVAQYDHDTGKLDKAILDTGFVVDDHNNPTICVRPDRRVVVFWTGHADPTVPIHYRRSAVPEDITQGWESTKHITTNTPGGFGWTYENLVQLSDEPDRLYVFWRGGNFNPTYSTTTGGDVWTTARNFVYYEQDGTVQRPYVKVHSNNTDTIHFAFTQGHPRNVHTSIFYMCYRAGKLYQVDGTEIGPWGTVVTPDQVDTVYDADANQAKAWVWDVAADEDGRPVIVYANFPTDTDHRYRYARWTGTEWFDVELTAAGDTISGDPAEPNYSGGISLDHSDPSVVLLSRQEPGGRHEVERWTTQDNGKTWSVEAITSGSQELNVRPVKPIGLTGKGALSMIWMAGEYPSYVDFQTRIIALGPDGAAHALE